MRSRRTIIQRAPVFLGCEGESEQAYGQFLNELLRLSDRPFHVEAVNLSPGAGDPISRLQRAKQEIIRRSKRRSEFRFKAVLLDSDQIDRDQERRRRAERLALELGIKIIWQEPCHEAILLRHLDGFARNRPIRSSDAEDALRSAWPDYRKPMTKVQLARRLTLEAVERAAAVEPSLLELLRAISLLR
jgi:hypothetical protein